MNAPSALEASSANRRVEAWLELIAVLPVTLLWVWSVVVFALMLLPSMAAQLAHAKPSAVESGSWLFACLLLGGGVGLVALVPALVYVACGAEPQYRLSRLQLLGVVVGACVAAYVLAGLRVASLRDAMWAMLFGAPLLIAVRVVSDALRARRQP